MPETFQILNSSLFFRNNSATARPDIYREHRVVNITISTNKLHNKTGFYSFKKNEFSTSFCHTMGVDIYRYLRQRSLIKPHDRNRAAARYFRSNTSSNIAGKYCYDYVSIMPESNKNCNNYWFGFNGKENDNDTDKQEESGNNGQ